MVEFIRLALYQLTRFPLQLLAANLIFFPLLEKRKFFIPKLILSLVIIFLIPIIFPNYTINLTIPGAWFSFAYILIFIIDSLIMLFLFKCRYDKLLFIGASAYVIQNFMFQLHTLIINYFLVSINSQFDNSSLAAGIVKICVEVVVITLSYLYIDHWQENIVKRLNNVRTITFSTLCILLVSVVSNYIMTDYGFSVPTSILSIIICLLLMLIHLGIFQNEKLQLDKEIVDHLVYLSSKQQEDVKRNIETINIKCHDLKHQIQNFRERSALNDNQQLYLKELEKDIRIYDSKITTGNEALDIVLTEKSLLCDHDSIKFYALCDGKLLSFMESNDIYSLFGNIIDNAIEAERKIDLSYRSISLRIFNKANAISVHVNNYYNSELNFINGLPQTTKEDKQNHGFGLLSIKRIVEKYSGTITFCQKDNQFIINILFYID